MAFQLRRKPALIVAVVVVGLLAAAGAWYFFAPKRSEQRSEAAPEGTALLVGSFRDGEPLHHASGTARLLAVDGRTVLRFEDFEATAGPDVYLYLTPKAHPTTTADVEGEGVKVRTPTAMGQATLRGDFNLELPEGIDAASYAGVALWCDTYNVLFGYAELTAA